MSNEEDDIGSEDIEDSSYDSEIDGDYESESEN